ncbi:MAG: hypothetical protein RLZZ176_2655, partial [Cyanobacteriota bacterium]
IYYNHDKVSKSLELKGGVVLNIEEIIEIANNQVFEHQGRHLNDLQIAILEGILQGRTYADIVILAIASSKVSPWE